MSVDLDLAGTSLLTAVPEAEVVQVVRPLVGRRRHEPVDVPGRAGSVVFTEEPGDRILSVELDLQGADFETRRAAVRRLADWADVGAPARLVLDDEPDRYHDAILDDDADPNEWLIRATIAVKFRVGPYALALDVSSETISVSGAGADSGTFDIDDEINAEPIVEITPTNGNLPSFTLVLNGYTLTYAGPTIASGDTLTISSISDTVTLGENGDTMLTGAFDPNDVAMADVSGTFPLLVPGPNAWSMTWDDQDVTEITLEITWRKRFR